MAASGAVTTEANGEVPVDRQDLPEFVEMSAIEMQRIPSPGTQRELKAQTGKSFDELCGANADPADRMQTMIWARLRKDRPGLRWDACADVGVQVQGDGPDPTSGAVVVPSLPSAGSGG